MENRLTATEQARRERMLSAARQRDLELCDRLGTIAHGHLLRVRQPLPYDVTCQIRADRAQEREQ